MLFQKMTRQVHSRRPSRLRLETLEGRIVPSSNVIDDFEASALYHYETALRFASSDVLLPIAAHDGYQGLVKQDGYEWMIRDEPSSQVHAGDTVSVWVKFADLADGRAYLGFDSRNTSDAGSPLSNSGTLAIVMAANTNQLILQKDSGTNGVASFTNLATTNQSYQADHWYRLEATWGATGTMTGKLYDSNGTTVLSTVNANTTAPYPNGAGFSLRSFGHDKYFDTVVVDTGSTDTPMQRTAIGGGLGAGWMAGNPPPPVQNGPAGSPAPIPWAYTNTPGSGLEIQLASFNQLTQVAIINGVVGLAAANNSANTGTVQVGWGDPVETPLLAQYIFRQKPGEPTRLIGASSVKHFFSSAHADSQHLNPGENDTYGSSLNATQDYYTYGSELDPVTGTLHSPIDRGTLSADGLVINGSRTFTNRIQYLLQVNVADLDPAQNPTGTHWYLMGNEFVGGEQDVTQSSRWVEVAPVRNGATGDFTFNYPQGSTGQLNFRTIPGLTQPAGPAVIQSTPSGNIFGSVNSVRVTFDSVMDPSTFTLAQVDSFTVTTGGSTTDLSGAITGITAVAGSNNHSFDIAFATQSTLGSYSLVIGPNILDTNGNPMDQNGNGIAGEVPGDEYSANFTLQGLKIISSIPTGNNHLPGDLINSLTVTFNEPVDVSTFTTDQIDDFYGPYGSIPINSITPIAGSNNTQFRIAFDPQVSTGLYTIDIGPYIYDLGGNPMDQNGNGIAGEYPDDIYHTTFGIQGLKVTTAVPNNTTPGQAYSILVTFNEAVNQFSFTPDQIPTFSGPDGDHTPFAIVPADGTYMRYNVLFAPLTAAGTYTMVIGPNINDFFGNAMDQDGDLIPGESTDVYTATFTLTSPRLVSATPPSSGVIDHVRLVFDRPMDSTSFDPSEFTITGPGGTTSTVTGVSLVPYTNSTTFDVTCAPLQVGGTWTITVGAGITDYYGNALAATSVNFTVAGPHLVSATLPPAPPYDHVRLLFDKSMDPTTFNTGEFTLTGPGGGAITVTDVTVVTGTNNTTFDVSFGAVTTTGTYNLAYTLGILDSSGIGLPPGSINFSISPTYTASATTFQNIELFGQTGTQTLTFQSGQVTADDDFGVINLGAGNNFNFYGTVYTQLYASSNGLITFGSGNTAYVPTNLAGNPAQAAIAPYWTDLIKTGTEPMILWTITNNQLIIEWYHVSNYPDGSSIPMTFQAILNLNTAGGPGDIVLNYVTVTGVGAGDDNGGITVGVKDAGGTGSVARTVQQDGTGGGHGDPLIQSGHAIRFH